MSLNPLEHVRAELTLVEEQRRIEEEEQLNSSFGASYPWTLNAEPSDGHLEWFYENCDEVPL